MRIILACLLLATASWRTIASPAETISFNTQVLPLLMERCAICHQQNERHGYLTIDNKQAYQAMVNIPSYTLPAINRIEPGKPQASYVWLKITGEHLQVGGKGWPMPFMGQLNQTEKTLIKLWIEQGAHNN